jgi:hypothetical protein
MTDKIKNKELTIRAHRRIAWRYRNPKGLSFFDMNSCPLCEIHYKYGECRGCPLAHVDGGQGCSNFTSYRHADLEYSLDKYGPAFEARAQFHEKVIEIIKKWPEERFTKEGWIYSGEEIPRKW